MGSSGETWRRGAAVDVRRRLATHPFAPYASLVASSQHLFDAVRSGLLPLHPLRVVAFGSRARGDGDGESDLDIMVVAQVEGSRAERSRIVRSRLMDIDVAMDIVVYTPDEYAKFRGWRSSVAAVADRRSARRIATARQPELLPKKRL